jgi:hypothetical protein
VLMGSLCVVATGMLRPEVSYAPCMDVEAK